MAKNQISTFIEGMIQIGYTKEEMIKFIERENAAIVYNPDDFDFIIKNNKILNIRKLVKKYD